MCILCFIVGGDFEVELLTRWTDEKNRGGKCQKGKEKKREDQRRERVRRKKIQMREKLEKSRNTVFFLMICGSGRSTSRLAEAAGGDPSAEMRDEEFHTVVT